MVGAKASGFRITSGSDHIKTFELPVEIPAGLFDTELPLNPERHIYIEYKATWESIRDDLATFTKDQIARHRRHDDR